MVDRHSKLIAKESLTAYERWELPQVEDADKSAPKISDVPVDEVEPLTAEQIEQIQRDAYQEGFDLGHKEGREAAQVEVRAEVQRLAQIFNALAEPLRQAGEAVEEELAALAVAIARQIVRREIKSEPEQIVAVVKDALGALPANSRQVRIHLHPDDAAIVRQSLSLGEQQEEEARRIVDDPALTRGGCRVETEHSLIDATVEKRLAAVVAQVMGGERSSDRGEG